MTTKSYYEPVLSKIDQQKCIDFLEPRFSYFNRFMFHKTKNKNKRLFCRNCLQCFSSGSVLMHIKKIV